MTQHIDNYELAIRDFSEAIRLDPKNAAAYLGRAYALAKIGEEKAAAADNSKAIHLGLGVPSPESTLERTNTAAGRRQPRDLVARIRGR